MPIYEYICEDCGKQLNFLVLKRDGFSPQCNRCQSVNLRRVMSRFRAIRSEESRLEAMADPNKWGDFDENDPKSMVKMMKNMGRELGDELGEDYDQLIEEAEQEAESTSKTATDGNADDTDNELI